MVWIERGMLQIESGRKGVLAVQRSSLKKGFDVRK